MKRALVLGARNFIGAALGQRLRDEGWWVRATSLNRADGIEPLDVRDAAAVDSAVREADAVFNLAACKDREIERLDACTEVNVRGVANVLAAVARCGDPKPAVVLLGSGEEYGNVDALPFREDGPTAPVSAYGITKLAATLLACGASREVPVVVLRPSVVYGPGQREPQLVASAVRAVLTRTECAIRGGSQTRDLVYVGDLAEAMVLAAEHAHGTARGAVIHVASGAERTVKDIAMRVLEIGGAGRLVVGPPSARPGDTKRAVFDVSRAKSLLGWHARTTLEHGIERTLAAERAIQRAD